MTDDQLRAWDAQKRAEIQSTAGIGGNPLTPLRPSSSQEVPDGGNSRRRSSHRGNRHRPPQRLPQVERSAQCPAPDKCPVCGHDVTYREASRPVLPECLRAGRGGSDSVSRLFLPAWQRSECLCEIREREQREAVEAQREAAHREATLRRRRETIARNWRESGIAGAEMERLRFDTFDTTRSLVMADAAAVMRAWAAAFHPQTSIKGFALSSPRFGCGKTHVAVATARVLLERGFTVWVTTMGDLLADCRREFNDKSGAAVGRTMARAVAVNLLVIDDFGTERIADGERGDWVREQLYNLFDKRCRFARPLIVTTNLDLAGIEDRVGGAHGGRVASRLMQLADWWDVDGPDGRVML